jgi:hypothetical protein
MMKKNLLHPFDVLPVVGKEVVEAEAGGKEEEGEGSRLALGSVLWIHDILVGIRIRGSMHLINGSGSYCFRH